MPTTGKIRFFIEFLKNSVFIWFGCAFTTMVLMYATQGLFFISAIFSTTHIITIWLQSVFLNSAAVFYAFLTPPTLVVSMFVSLVQLPKRIYRFFKRRVQQRIMQSLQEGATTSFNVVVDFIKENWPYMMLTFVIMVNALSVTAKKLEARSQYYSYSALFYALFGTAIGVASALFGANIGEILTAIRDTQWIKAFVDALINGWESFRALFPDAAAQPPPQIPADPRAPFANANARQQRRQAERSDVITRLNAPVPRIQEPESDYVATLTLDPAHYMDDWCVQSDKATRAQIVQRQDLYAPFYLPTTNNVTTIPVQWWTHESVLRDQTGHAFIREILNRLSSTGKYAVCGTSDTLEYVSLEEYTHERLVQRGMFSGQGENQLAAYSKGYYEYIGYTPFQVYFLLLHNYLKVINNIPVRGAWPVPFQHMFARMMFSPYIYMMWYVLSIEQRRELRRLHRNFFTGINPTALIHRCQWSVPATVFPFQPSTFLGPNGRAFQTDQYDIKPWLKEESGEFTSNNVVLEAFTIREAKDSVDKIRDYISSKFPILTPYYNFFKKLGMITLIMSGFGLVAGLTYRFMKNASGKARKTAIAIVIVVFAAILYVMYVEIPKWRIKREQKRVTRSRREAQILEATSLDVLLKGAEFAQAANDYWKNQTNSKAPSPIQETGFQFIPNNLYPVIQESRPRNESNYPKQEKEEDQYEDPELEEELDRLEEEFYKDVENNVADILHSKASFSKEIEDMIRNAKTNDDFKRIYFEIETDRRKFDKGPERYAEDLILTSADKALSKMKKIHSGKSKHFQTWLAQGGGQQYKRGKRGKKVFSQEASDVQLLLEASKTRTIDPSYLNFFRKFMHALNDHRSHLDRLYRMAAVEEERFKEEQRAKETEGWTLVSNKTKHPQNQQQIQGNADNEKKKPSRKEKKQEAKMKKSRQQEILELNEKCNDYGIDPIVRNIPKQIKHGTAKNEFILEQLRKKVSDYEKNIKAPPTKKVAFYGAKETGEQPLTRRVSPTPIHHQIITPSAPLQNLLSFDEPVITNSSVQQANVANSWTNGPPAWTNSPLHVYPEPPVQNNEAVIRTNLAVPSTNVLCRLTFDDPQGQVWKAGFRVGNNIISCAHPKDFNNYPIKASLWQGSQKIVHAEETEILKGFPDHDLSILKLKGQIAQNARSLKMKSPQLNDQITIIWSKQGSSGNDYHTATGKITSIVDDNIYYDAHTEEGASGAAIMDREGKNVYGVHLSSNTNKDNRGLAFTPEIIKMINDFHLN